MEDSTWADYRSKYIHALNKYGDGSDLDSIKTPEDYAKAFADDWNPSSTQQNLLEKMADNPGDGLRGFSRCYPEKVVFR